MYLKMSDVVECSVGGAVAEGNTRCGNGVVLVRFLACDLGDDGSVCRLYVFYGVADCCEESLFFIWIGHHQFVVASLADLKRGVCNFVSIGL
jgi:hypothetical protein